MQNKKAQADLALVYSTVGIVVLLVAIGIIFSTSFKAMNELNKIAEDNSAAHANETITWAGNNTIVSLLESRIQESSIIVYNNGSKLAKGVTTRNYTTSVASVTIINETPTGGDSKGLATGSLITNKINVSYTYNIGSQEYNTTLLSKEGVKVVSDFQPTWALIAAIGILITALLMPLVIWIIKSI